MSPDDPSGTELVLESTANPAGKAYQEAVRAQGRPAVQFLVNDMQAAHDRLASKGVKFAGVTNQTAALDGSRNGNGAAFRFGIARRMTSSRPHPSLDDAGLH